MTDKTQSDAIAAYLAKIKDNNVADRACKYGALRLRMFEIVGKEA